MQLNFVSLNSFIRQKHGKVLMKTMKIVGQNYNNPLIMLIVIQQFLLIPSNQPRPARERGRQVKFHSTTACHRDGVGRGNSWLATERGEGRPNAWQIVSIPMHRYLTPIECHSRPRPVDQTRLKRPRDACPPCRLEITAG